MISLIKNEGYPPPAERIFTSGMLRAEQTADILYGAAGRTAVPEIAEYNFGIFEMKSYDELKDTDSYQAWISDEIGEECCPEGESKKMFNERVVRGYARILDELLRTEEAGASVICHGGTIVCIMEYLQPNEKNYYEWQPASGRGYSLSYEAGRYAGYKPV